MEKKTLEKDKVFEMENGIKYIIRNDLRLFNSRLPQRLVELNENQEEYKQRRLFMKFEQKNRNTIIWPSKKWATYNKTQVQQYLKSIQESKK